MNVIKTKIISLKLAKHESKERLDGPGGPARLGYARRFSVPCGQAVESWKKENSLGVCPEEEEEEYPIYQSASFRRSVITVLACLCQNQVLIRVHIGGYLTQICELFFCSNFPV